MTTDLAPPADGGHANGTPPAPPPALRTVGVVGAGTMGRGLAQTLAQSGLHAVVVDVHPEALDAAEREVARGVRFRRFHAPAGTDLEPDADVLGRVTYAGTLDALAEADLVVENATERWEVKRDIYPALDRVCAAGVVFAANTSAVSITRLGGLTGRPDRVVGLHLMNPVPLKPAAEIIRGFHTSEAAIGAVQALLARMGKAGVVVEDMPGFVTNRVLMLTINEAVFLLQDGVSTARDVDRIFRLCFGHPMGPLETADLIGLDTILDSLVVLYEAYNDPKYRPCPLLKKMVAAGLLGRKSGQGFHDYPYLTS